MLEASRSSIPALLARLAAREDAAQRRCSLLANDLELGRAAIALLELVCHADAAIDDLRAFGGARGARFDGVAQAVAGALTSTRAWLDRLLLGAGAEWRGALGEVNDGLAIARELERAARAEGDRLVCSWCALWLAQRTPMVRTLELYAREPRAAPSW